MQFDKGGPQYLHILQASLGPDAKIGEKVWVKLDLEGMDTTVIGTLEAGRCDQMRLNIVFDRNFMISHSSTSDVFIAGYASFTGDEEDNDDDSEDRDDDEDMEVPMAVPLTPMTKT